MKKAAILGLTAAVMASLVVVAQEIRRDGRWEVKTQMSMPNMPNVPNMPAGMSMPETTTTQCITKEEAADPQKAMAPPPAGRGSTANDCKVTDYKVVGNTVTYNMACTTPQAMNAKAQFVYKTDAYDGTLTFDVARGGQTMQMTQKYSGKRLGDCVK